MSRRAIRRVEEALEAEKSNQLNNSDTSDDDSEYSTGVSLQPRPSMFALLDDDDGDDDSDDQPTEHTEPQQIEQPQTDNVKEEDSIPHADDKQPPEPPLEPKSEQQGKTKKKKKRKRKKGAKKAQDTVDRENDPDWIALNEETAEVPKAEEKQDSVLISDEYFTEEDGEEVRQEAQRIMAIIEGMVITDVQNELELATSVIRVEPRLLNADSELMQLFGSRVIESERRDEANAASGRRRGRGIPKQTQSKRRVSLVSPRDTWPGYAPGLTMILDKDATNNNSDGIRYFRYRYEASYQRVQDQYRSFVEMHDPNLLVQLCAHHPYHVDTLLQLAELYRQMGELDRAAEQIERCLYVLESSWNISFKPFDGRCRLRFDVIENRSVYVALFRYSQLLTRRGLHRTALEISKLLLNFDPQSDPMGMLMLADSYALLSGEYEWINQMRRGYQKIPIQYYPNFAASEAVAHESKRLGLTGIANRTNAGKAKSGGKSKQEDATGDEGSKAGDEALVEALLTYPMLLRPLLSAIQDNSGVWTGHRLFDEAWYGAGYEDYGVLTRMCRVYAERSKALWSSSHNKAMLIRCAEKAGELDTAAGMGKDPATGRLTSAFVSDKEEHERVARCRALRAEAGEWLRHSGLYQKVQIADFTDSTTNLPAELLAGDPSDRTVGAMPPRPVGMGQSVLEFLQSMLPWRDPGDAG